MMQAQLSSLPVIAAGVVAAGSARVSMAVGAERSNAAPEPPAASSAVDRTGTAVAGVAADGKGTVGAAAVFSAIPMTTGSASPRFW